MFLVTPEMKWKRNKKTNDHRSLLSLTLQRTNNCIRMYVFSSLNVCVFIFEQNALDFLFFFFPSLFFFFSFCFLDAQHCTLINQPRRLLGKWNSQCVRKAEGSSKCYSDFVFMMKVTRVDVERTSKILTVVVMVTGSYEVSLHRIFFANQNTAQKWLLSSTEADLSLMVLQLHTDIVFITLWSAGNLNRNHAHTDLHTPMCTFIYRELHTHTHSHKHILTNIFTYRERKDKHTSTWTWIHTNISQYWYAYKLSIFVFQEAPMICVNILLSVNHKFCTEDDNWYPDVRLHV